jgi:hypothetical protein
MAVQATKGPKFACPQCNAALDDYAPACKECGCDVLSNDPRPPELLANSINRNDRSVFFAVSPLKLIVMSVVTCGFYELFWFYKNWHYVQEHTNKTEVPLINSIFRVFTYYYLMVEIRRAGAAQQKDCPFSPALLAFGYMVLNVCGALSRGLPVVALAALLSPLALVPVQRYVNDTLNSENSTAINSRFTVANWIAIVIGGSLVLWSIIVILTRPA